MVLTNRDPLYILVSNLKSKSSSEKKKGQNKMALSIETTGLYTSQNHQQAREEGKLTAGELSKILSKKFFIKITASELKDYATEWHHSGFYKPSGNHKKIMGRTFFFDYDPDQDQYYLFHILADRGDAENLQFEADMKKNIHWFAISDHWDHDYSGYHGKKKYFKRLSFHTGTGLIPAAFVEISEEIYNANLHREKEQLPPYTNLINYLK